MAPTSWLPPDTLGMGCMRLSTDEVRDQENAVATIHTAMDAGVRLFDTAASYGHSNKDLHHGEALLAHALGARIGEMIVVTKCGMRRPGGRWMVDGRRKTILQDAELSRRALAVESIDLLLLHAPDPKTPLETSVRALAAAKKSGLCRRVGLCNVRIAEVERARALVDIDAVQVALNPFDEQAARGGLVDHCRTLGIPVIAHSPLGGPTHIAKLRKILDLHDLAEGSGLTLESMVLAWLRSFEGVHPIPGVRQNHAAASTQWRAELRDDVRAMLDELFDLGPLLRTSKLSRRPRSTHKDGQRKVTLFVGIPGAGKSSIATQQDALRLSRDERGGSLKQLAAALDAELQDGATRVVMDATYPTRAQRNRVIETAWAHRANVVCEWLETSLADAQVNAIERMLGKTGRLLSPEEMKQLSKDDPRLFPPMAQHRYLDRLEPPDHDEGFIEVRRTRFVRRTDTTRSQSGLLLDAEVFGGVGSEIEPELLQHLAQRERLPTLVLAWVPGASVEAANAWFAPIKSQLSAELALCTHAPGPPRCWCRRPLPGLPLAWMRREKIAPSKLTYVGASKGSERLAEQLGAMHLPGSML